MKIINQRTSNDCVVCCVAMVAGVSYDEAKKAFNDNAPYSFMQEGIALVRLGLFSDHRDPYIMRSGRLYLVTVPSLNLPGVNHRIVIDAGDKYEVYDPNNGVPGKKFYKDIKDVDGFSELVVVIDTRRKK